MPSTYDITLYDAPVSGVLHKYSKLVFDYPKEKIWNQKGVSLERRLEKDPKLQKLIQKSLKPTNLKKYIVVEDDSAPTRCIDGRILVGWKPNSKASKRHLGPKVAGGTVHAALAHRIVDTENLRENLLFEEDLKYVIERFKDIGIGSGGHIDDHQTGYNTGCGAVDNINLILDRLQRPEHQEQLRGLSKLILGEAYDAKNLINEVIGRMLYLDALKPTYMPKKDNDPTGEFLYKKTVMKIIKAQASQAQETVPALTGTHNEVAVILNFVPGTTFDTDHFSYDNNNQIQVFGWDVWHMYEEARRLYRYDMYDKLISQNEAINNRMKYVITRTLLGISTLMVLTDGSLKLITVTSPEI